MLSSSSISASVARLWPLALTDAELRDGVDAILHIFAGQPAPGSPGGTAVEPGGSACTVGRVRDAYPFLDAHIERSRRSANLYEILTYSGVEPHVLLAVLRHEIEHILQYRQTQALTTTSKLYAHGVASQLGEDSVVFRVLYASLPTERAADEAGRRLARATLGDPANSLRGGPHDTLIFGPADAPAADELCSRTTTHLAILPDWFGAAALDQFPLTCGPRQATGHFCDYLMPGTGIPHAEALAAHPEFRAVKDQILKAGGRLDEHRSSSAETRATLRPLLLQAETIGQTMLKTTLPTG